MFIFGNRLTEFSACQEIQSQIEDENNRQITIEKNRKKFEKILNSLDNGIKYWKKEVKKQKAELVIIENTYPNKVLHPIQYAFHKKKADTAKALHGEYISKLNSAQRKKNRFISSASNDLPEPSRFIQFLFGTINWFKINFLKYWDKTIYFIILILLSPLLWKFSWLFIIAPISQKRKAIHLINKMEEGSIADGMSANNLTVTLKPSENLTARMDWVHRHQEDCRKRTRLLWKWSSPFISYASGLHHLTEIRAPEISGAEVGLAHSKNPLYAAIEIELINHPGFIVHPKYIVGISGNIQISSRSKSFPPTGFRTVPGLQKLYFCMNARQKTLRFTHVQRCRNTISALLRKVFDLLIIPKECRTESPAVSGDRQSGHKLSVCDSFRHGTFIFGNRLKAERICPESRTESLGL